MMTAKGGGDMGGIGGCGGVFGGDEGEGIAGGAGGTAGGEGGGGGGGDDAVKQISHPEADVAPSAVQVRVPSRGTTPSGPLMKQ